MLCASSFFSHESEAQTIRLHPFRAWRPAPALADRVAAPPYDVVNRSEAAAFAAGNPVSFLRVGRSDIDLPPEVGEFDQRVYDQARSTLRAFMADGTLRQDAAPSIYLYELTREGRSQVGVVGCVHLDDYANDLIKKHERTTKEKEDDRTKHIVELNAHAEPVILTFAAEPTVDALLAAEMRRAPVHDFTSSDGVRHRVWHVQEPATYVAAFQRIPALYVADGHHRCASAWRAREELKDRNPDHTGQEEYNWFPAVLFPSSQLLILSYNRVVRDLRGLTAEAFLERLRGLGEVSSGADPVPDRAGVFCVYLAGSWYRVAFDPSTIDATDPVKSLDADLLYERVLASILGIGDIRTDKRVEFVGGARGTAELARRVDSGEMAVAFSLFPVQIAQVMAISDAGAIMPPKSTWFEPKLRSGLFVHSLDP